MAERLAAGDPTHVGQYRLLGRLGAGGMGSVYLAASPGGRQVAVKVIRAEYADDPEFRRRFRAEVEAARKVSGFYTAVVIDADPDAPAPWLATAFVSGPTLADEVREHGPLDAGRLVSLTGALAEALQAIHTAGVIHRDLKPANVLLAEDGPRVIDFGISRALEATSLTATGAVIGTPYFMSPEQCSGAPISPASDIFSLGSVLTYAATGRGPFGEGPAVTLLYRVVSGEPELTAVPALIRPLVAACLAKDPAVRPTPQQVLAMLGDLRGGEAPGPRAQRDEDNWPPVPGGSTVPSLEPTGPVPAPGSGGSRLPPGPPVVCLPGAPDPDDPRLGIGAARVVDPGSITSRAEFFRALHKVREHAALTGKEVAAAAGLARGTVRGYFERGRLPAEREALRRILRACGVPEEDLSAWDGALVRVRSQRQQATKPRKSQAQDSRSGERVKFVFGPSGEEAAHDRGGVASDTPDLLFRVYLPRDELYAEQRREMLRHFRVWLTTVQGQDIREEDFSARDGETVAFFLGPGQPRPPLREDYREFLSFVEHCAHDPSTALTHLTGIGIEEATGTTVVADYAKKIRRMEMDLRHSRENRLLMLQQSLEGELLDKGGDPQGIATLQVRIRSVLEQVIPPPTAAAAMPAIGDGRQPGLSPQAGRDAYAAGRDVHINLSDPALLHMTFNAGQVIYAANESIRGTAGFSPTAKRLLALIYQRGGEQAGPLCSALHELEDPGIPASVKSEAKRTLTAFLADLADSFPGAAASPTLMNYLEA